ncbi:ABC transporter permease [Nocardioides oleivorans]|uniref:Autoinducer 2 import system permease protein LsrD n=1 Tax=Nocardioides oleivorans TaxID=273676 RepID=A0A4Q2RYD2_9ACTN|nr:ABC transporter permease [Nocardioides oleivorans]RYB93004.1 ABC transporter permease [Nocardioides oleivorans]
MSADATTSPSSTAGRALLLTEGTFVQRVLRGAVTPGGAVFILAAVLFVAVIVVNPYFGEPPQLIRFVGRTAPIAIAAMGQYYVIVSGEFDLSMGAVIATQVVIAGNYIGDDESRVLPALVLMLVVGAAIGVVNGLATTLLRVPSFIVTLGTMLALGGLVRYLTGGAATGNPVDSFRQIGRGGIEDVPVLDIIPYPVIILAAVAVASVLLMRSPFGRTLIATGDNPDAAGLAGAHVWWVKTRAFMLSSLSATIAGILLVGYAGVHPSVGSGYEFQAITAVVLGGVVLGGGRGWVLSAAAGAFALELLFSFLNFQEVESTWRNTVQGLIIILAVALAARAWSFGRRPTRATSNQSAAPSPTPARPGTEPGEN